MAKRVLLHPEQLLVVGLNPEGEFLFGGRAHRSVPWNLLGGAHLFALDELTLTALLSNAADRYQILAGYHSERRGLRGFEVGIGAWGHAGRVECRTLDCWAFEPLTDDAEAEVSQCQTILRDLCRRLNAEKVVFRATAFRWLSGLYKELGQPLEPDGYPLPLPTDVAEMARAAHVGGPILHVRSSLKPFVTLDRDRAYGSAMLESLPCGFPAEVHISDNGLHRWVARDLMMSHCLVAAEVEIESETYLPLLPLHASNTVYSRSRTIYPVGRFRGTWTGAELAHLEQSGHGRVLAIMRAVVFEGRPILAGVIRYLRRLEPDLSIEVKRLEHMLYGKCARSLSISRVSSGPMGRPPTPPDLLDSRSLQRVSGSVQIRRHALIEGDARHRLWRITAQLSSEAERGSMDRPDRSAHITAANRIAMWKLIDQLAETLPDAAKRVGRVYVDGIDLEATPEELPHLEQVGIRRHGRRMRIYRAGAFAATLHDGSRLIEAAGLPHRERPDTERDLVEVLNHQPELDGGPLAGGRYWAPRGTLSDPRMAPGQVSRPLFVEPHMPALLGFDDPGVRTGPGP